MEPIIFSILIQEDFRRFDYSESLSRADGCFELGGTVRRPVFDLDKGELIILNGDQIDFAALSAEIALEQGPALSLQKGGRGIFAAPSPAACGLYWPSSLGSRARAIKRVFSVRRSSTSPFSPSKRLPNSSTITRSLGLRGASA